MKIVCSTNMPFVEEAFRTLGNPIVLEGRNLTPADVQDAELMAIRSTTRVDAALLENSRVRFVGTATIGTDHMDIPYLEQRGIHWCFAPGCNANSVSEYVTAALLCVAEHHGLTLVGKTLGVIGVGNVGKRVVSKGLALGMKVLRNDPPRERAGDAAPGESFVPLDRLLAESDFITLHVPLTRDGQDATYHLAGARFFERMKPGTVYLNCARGAVTDTNALLHAMDRNIVSHTTIDTWEGEPDFRIDLLTRVDLGSPHIAGHSFEGKAYGTLMVYESACRHLGVAPSWKLEPHLPPPPVPEYRLNASGKTDQQALREAVKAVYDIEADDARFRAIASLPTDQRKRQFDKLRSNYPMRREFRFTRIHLTGASKSLDQSLRALGFQRHNT
ncbi:MAG: hypothetical protein A2498_13670 [Lentisphaerae bacterium RIFOXYC12_FULL_60_16]|nr:MAG: hypothetical protein A2498_13670 [Lentisphaerae bacterium RIFOXYC12_FULL_60_16]